MESTCLRIQFTPLLKETEKHKSNCCLEIVPEVSCLQNLDKLTWKQEPNCIEYTIPMTYKIILRKQCNMNANNDIGKTYHSCVDLLLPTSKSTFDLASGDISRIISDTFVLSKIGATAPKKEEFINSSVVDKSYIGIQSGTSTGETVTTLEIIDTTSMGNEKEGTNEYAALEKQEFNKNNIIKTLCDKLTNTDTRVFSLFGKVVNSKCLTKLRNTPESKHKLSLSPMSSNNTHSSIDLLNKSNASTATTSNFLNAEQDLAPINFMNTLSGSSSGNRFCSMSPQEGDFYGYTLKNVLLRTTDQSPHSIRVAQYLNYIKSELLPLNMFLDKLIIKCSLLGVNRVSYGAIESSRNNLLLYKPVCMREKCVKIETCEKSNSNRAVYSVIYDG